MYLLVKNILEIPASGIKGRQILINFTTLAVVSVNHRVLEVA